MNLPKRVTIELTNRCNRRCDGCPSLKTYYPYGDMNLDLLDKTLKQLPNNTIMVPFFRGESLIHPRFYEAMKRFSRFKNVQIATNGDLLTRDYQNALITTCTFISYSLHKFEYPDEVMGIVSFLERARNTNITTQVSILDSLISRDKKPFIKKWLKHVDRVRIYAEHSTIGYGDVTNEHKNIEISENLPCTKPWNDMVVYWDGKIGLCNHDWNNKSPFGDLNNQTIVSVWNGDEYKKIRGLHTVGLRKQVETCKDCDYWMTDHLPDKMFGELYIGDFE